MKDGNKCVLFRLTKWILIYVLVPCRESIQEAQSTHSFCGERTLRGEERVGFLLDPVLGISFQDSLCLAPTPPLQEIQPTYPLTKDVVRIPFFAQNQTKGFMQPHISINSSAEHNRANVEIRGIFNGGTSTSWGYLFLHHFVLIGAKEVPPLSLWEKGGKWWKAHQVNHKPCSPSFNSHLRVLKIL